LFAASQIVAVKSVQIVDEFFALFKGRARVELFLRRKNALAITLFDFLKAIQPDLFIFIEKVMQVSGLDGGNLFRCQV
jgi:hypothetical protein